MSLSVCNFFYISTPPTLEKGGLTQPCQFLKSRVIFSLSQGNPDNQSPLSLPCGPRESALGRTTGPIQGEDMLLPLEGKQDYCCFTDGFLNALHL